MITYQDIKKANDTIKAIDIQGSDYAQVSERIKAFRMVFPTGTIETEIVSNENGVIIMRASVYATGIIGGDDEIMPARILLGTGTACEKEGSNFINKFSAYENCETSCVGRALGMCGFGIDTSVASYEEVANAKLNQGERKASPKQLDILRKTYVGANLQKLLEAQGITKLEDISLEKASELISKLGGTK